jgi:alkylhydroperoxidase/carboxymuconolactone decarboxylase family protein YurZ
LHLKGAKRLGISRTKAEGLMAHVAHYCGWPTALQGFKAIDRVYGAEG